MNPPQIKVFYLIFNGTTLVAVNKLRHPVRGGGVSEKTTKDDTGGRGVIQKMTDDNDSSFRRKGVQ